MNFNLLQHIRGNDDYSVIWLFNIGLEKYWNGEVFTVKNSGDDIVVNHMEEMNLLIAKKQDILILRDMPSKDYLDALKAQGITIPTIVCPNIKDETKSISEIVLEDTEFIGELRELALSKGNVVFVPYGVSYLEEDIAKKLDVTLFGSPNDVNKKINNKVFSREFALSHDFRVPAGHVCKGYDELKEKSAEYLESYGKIIIKEPCGASGKGLWVVETSAKLKSTLLIIKRFFGDNLDGDWVVEEWCTKQCDLNYQVYVGNDGEVEVFSVKEQKVDGTVYIGSVIPPSFSEDIFEECRRDGMIIGKELYDMGYRGVLGIDAMILESGELVPIVEINGRFTLSTYVSFLDVVFGKVNKIFAFYRRLSMKEVASYSELSDKLSKAGHLYDGNRGMFVYTSETINADRVGDYGRMFGLIFAENEEDMMSQHEDIVGLIS